MNHTAAYFGKTIITSLFAIVLSAAGASAATFMVSNTNDAGAGSLRQAILDANAAAGDDVINFDSSFNVARTITTATVMTITGNGGLTINGTGTNLLTISGNNATHIFELSGLNSPSIGAININNLTIANGFSAVSGASNGGGISINFGASGAGTYTPINFTANNVTFTNNNGGVNEGGAIGCTRQGIVNINSSTFTRNRSNGGGAIDLGTGVGTCSSNVSNSSFVENTTSGDYVVVCCGNGTGGLTITNSAFYQNGSNGSSNTILVSSGSGLTMTNTTVANNRNTGAAVDIAMNSLSAVNTLTSVTIAGNYATGASTPAGLDQTANINSLTVGNSIIANNFNSTAAKDYEIGSNNTFTSQGYNLLENVSGIIGGTTTGNLIGVDPWLDGTPRNNGSATKTLALRRGSPAIDAGNPTTFPATDQRGITRPQDGDGNGNSRSDIGAFERRVIDIVPTDKADFDGDGKTDIGIFRPLVAGEWWVNRSSTGQTFALQFGASTDRITPADYTGDGKADIAFFRPSTGQWYVLRSEDFSFFALPFGANGDVPVPGDYDADGKADFAVFRPSSSTWFISQSSGAPTRIVQFGIAGDQPVVADYDGDGKSDIAIFRNAAGSAQWWIERSAEGSFALQFGAATDKAVQGDYTGDGKADVAIWRPSTGEWFIVRIEDSSFYGFPFGASTDIPAPGDYDGDGKFDATVFRPSSATWFIARSTAGTQIVQFGASGDRPLPNAFVP